MRLSPSDLKGLERKQAAPPLPRRRKPVSSPNREIVMMPCGDWALPAEIMHVFGDAISKFICDKHGEVKVTKKWMKEARNKATVLHMERTPSEFGYQVSMLQDGSER
jgi:hypothetical protein